MNSKVSSKEPDLLKMPACMAKAHNIIVIKSSERCDKFLANGAHTHVPLWWWSIARLGT